jgi:hypothetical protein
MRYIFRYDEAAKKHLSKLLKKKLPEPQPWLHVFVKTVSQRNPWSGIAIAIWDTRQVIFEHRQQSGTAGAFTTDQFHVAETGMHRAIDNRQPLVGGRKDINEFFELGPEFDASHGSAFNGPLRVRQTKLSKRRAKKAGLESMNIGDSVKDCGLTVDIYFDERHIWRGIAQQDDAFLLLQDDYTIIDKGATKEELVDKYNLTFASAANECFSIVD